MQITFFSLLATFLVALFIWQCIEGPVIGFIYLVKYFFLKKPEVNIPISQPVYDEVKKILKEHPSGTAPVVPAHCHTAITKFVIVKPAHEKEKAGEILELSQAGEYCPTDGSPRHYGLYFLLNSPQYYAIHEIVQQGNRTALATRPAGK